MAVLTNYILNPSVEVATNDMNITDPGVTMTRVATGATKGSWAGQFVCNAATDFQGSVHLAAAGIGGSSVPINIQFDITVPGSSAMVASLQWFYTDASDAFAAHHFFTAAAGTSHITYPEQVSDAGKTLDTFVLFIRTDGTLAVTFQVDGVSAGASLMYIDGDQGAGYAWTGTAHGSASTYTEPANGYLDILPTAGTNADAPVLVLP